MPVGVGAVFRLAVVFGLAVFLTLGVMVEAWFFLSLPLVLLGFLKAGEGAGFF
jgi:hypothetical protein